MKKCECISYNRPDIGGGIRCTALDPSIYFPDIEKKICVDTCIIEDILNLWKAGIWTSGSCCGHNGFFSRNIIIADGRRAKEAQKIVGNGIDILYWELITNTK